MSDNLMSRRKFLVSAGTVAAAAGLAGVGLAKSAQPAAAVTAAAALPWPYPTTSAEQPEPEILARLAYEVYYAAGCAEATWYPIVQFLAEKSDTDPAYAPWATLPLGLFRFGGGGVASWGTLCGTCNGSAAIIAMTGASAKITDEVFQYYGETPLPTNGMDKARVEGWTPSAFGGKTAPIPLTNVPTSTAHSQLCHASLSQWTMTTSAADGSAEQKDRCAKACHDMVLQTTTLLNAYWLDNARVAPAGTLDDAVAGCGAVANGCHSSAKGKMACDSCHDETGAGPHGN